MNISRGKLVSEADLAEELARGTIAGAALDVFEHEPLDPASPLWDLPNVLITPHTSAFRADYWDAAVTLFSDNLRSSPRRAPASERGGQGGGVLTASGILRRASGVEWHAERRTGVGLNGV